MSDKKEESKQENDYTALLQPVGTKQEGYICPRTKLQCDDECCVSASDCHIKITIGIISEPKQGTMSEVIKKAIDTQLKKEIFEEVFNEAFEQNKKK